MKQIILIIVCCILIYGADLDFDGIPDKKDYCPRTPLLAVVNKHGCQINKKIPFNVNSELGYQYSIDYKIPFIFFKNAVFFETYSFSVFLSKINYNNSYKTYNNNISFSKNLYAQNSYFRYSLFFYLKTFYSKSTYAFKLTDYLNEKEFLFFYKFKRHTKYKRNINTFFVEKVLKYPKVIILPFFYMENSAYKTDSFKYYKFFGVHLIFKLNNIYLKYSFLANNKWKNKVISFSIGKNF